MKASQNDFELTFFGYFYLENLYTNFTVDTDFFERSFTDRISLKVDNRYVWSKAHLVEVSKIVTLKFRSTSF